MVSPSHRSLRSLLPALLCLGLLSLGATGQERWKHSTLDLSFVMPTGWSAVEGPVTMKLTTLDEMGGRRRPSLEITWEQTPPTFAEFEQLLKSTIAKKAASKGLTYQLLGSSQEEIASFPARTYTYRVKEKGNVFKTSLSLVRLSKHAGYRVVTECMQADDSVAQPVFAKVLRGLRLGLPRKKPR